MSIQLPDLSNVINSQLIDKSPASSSNPHPPSNRRQNRNVNPPRRLEDYYLGAVGENFCDVQLTQMFQPTTSQSNIHIQIKILPFRRRPPTLFILQLVLMPSSMSNPTLLIYQPKLILCCPFSRRCLIRHL